VVPPNTVEVAALAFATIMVAVCRPDGRRIHVTRDAADRAGHGIRIRTRTGMETKVDAIPPDQGRRAGRPRRNVDRCHADRTARWRATNDDDEQYVYATAL